MSTSQSLWRKLLCLAIILAGCAGPNVHLHGWVDYDVPAGPVPAGWTNYKSADGGVSLSVPTFLIKWNQNDQAQADAFMDLVRRTVPNAAHSRMLITGQAFTPDLQFIDTSPGSLKTLAYSHLLILRMNIGQRPDLDTVEAHYRSQPNAQIERMNLPIGPCLKQTLLSTIIPSPGVTVKMKTTIYMFLHRFENYVVRFVAPVERYAVMQPILDQIMQTVRVSEPIHLPDRPTPVIPPRGGIGGPGMMPGDPGYGQMRPSMTPPAASPPPQVPDQTPDPTPQPPAVPEVPPQPEPTPTPPPTPADPPPTPPTTPADPPASPPTTG